MLQSNLSIIISEFPFNQKLPFNIEIKKRKKYRKNLFLFKMKKDDAFVNVNNTMKAA